MDNAHVPVGSIEPTRPRRSQDAITVLFAAALDGDSGAEGELRRLAVDSDRAAEALMAVAFAYGRSEARRVAPSPSEVAATDQLIAAVLAAVRAPR